MVPTKLLQISVPGPEMDNPQTLQPDRDLILGEVVGDFGSVDSYLATDLACRANASTLRTVSSEMASLAFK